MRRRSGSTSIPAGGAGHDVACAVRCRTLAPAIGDALRPKALKPSFNSQQPSRSYSPLSAIVRPRRVVPRGDPIKIGARAVDERYRLLELQSLAVSRGGFRLRNGQAVLSHVGRSAKLAAVRLDDIELAARPH